MFYALILTSIFTFSLQAMQQPVTLLWDLQDVLVRPKDNIPLLPSCLTPKTLQKDLIDAARNNTSYTNIEAAQHLGNLPLGFKAWLLDLISGEELQKITLQEKESIAQQKSLFTKPLFKLAFPIVIENAFTPQKSVSYLTPITEMIALVQACQKHGCKTALASNRNSEDFAEIERQHPSVVKLFEHHFTSGKPGQPGTSTKLQLLTSEPAFFIAIKNSLGQDRKYYYINIEDDKESLDAARAADIQTLSIPSNTNSEEFKKSKLTFDAFKAKNLKTQLVNHGLLLEDTLGK